MDIECSIYYPSFFFSRKGCYPLCEIGIGYRHHKLKGKNFDLNQRFYTVDNNPAWEDKNYFYIH